jgi:hypothetical protein
MWNTVSCRLSDLAGSGVGRSLGAILLISCGVGGCATLPEHPVERALYSDLRQIVDTEQRVGWLVDVYEIPEHAPTALQSVCQVEVEHRLKLLDWFDRRIEEEGGPAEEAYESNGHDLGAIDELLTLERMRLLLEFTDERAEAECPFYYRPDPEFAGVQTDTNRFVGLIESTGGLQMLITTRGVAVGGSGGFRLLPGFGISDRFTLAAGLELGGTGTLSLSQDESGSQQFAARPYGAVPLLLRLHDDTWVYDFEVAALAQYYNDQITVPPGFRVAFGIGLGTTRIGAIMPVGVGLIAYELMPAFQDLPVTHTIQIGTRVGINYDP